MKATVRERRKLDCFDETQLITRVKALHLPEGNPDFSLSSCKEPSQT